MGNGNDISFRLSVSIDVDVQLCFDSVIGRELAGDCGFILVETEGGIECTPYSNTRILPLHDYEC